MKQRTILSKTEAGKEPASVPISNSKLLSLNSKLDFRGIPYSLIINGLLAKFGFEDGIVPEGARNTTLYKLVRQLRYICDFNSTQIQSILPNWGLTDKEVMGTVESAVTSTRGQDFPSELRSVLNDITKPDLSTTAKRHEYLERLNPLPKQMPWLFSSKCDRGRIEV